MAAPTLDAFTANTPAAGVNHTWPHTIGSGGSADHHILLAAMHISSNDDLVTSILFNGVAPAYFDNTNDGTSRIYAAVWLNPAVGEHTVSVSTSESTTLDGASVSYLDADQVQGVSLLGQAASSTQALITVTTPVDNCRVGMFAYNDLESPISVGSGQTLQISDKDMALVTVDAAVTPAGEAYPQMNVTTATRWQAYAFAVAEVQGGGLSVLKTEALHLSESLSFDTTIAKLAAAYRRRHH